MNEFFQELTVINNNETFDLRYRDLSAFFYRLINRATMNARSGIIFAGPFAKTNYILKEFGADKKLSRIVNNSRVRFRNISELTAEEKQRFYPYDFEAVVRLTALVERCEIPESLISLFPSGHEQRPKGRMAGDYLRCIIDGFDEHYIYATSELFADKPAKIDYLTPSVAYPYDGSYLKEILFVGAQINVIRPRIDDDTIYPELIIFEPDMLIDVSTVASCFESYATDPRIALIKRISPPPVGDPINLGNFASQMLDEEIHSHSRKSYNQSAIDFFRQNALSLAAVPPQPGFHDDAKRQRDNIHNALHRQLPESFSDFDLKNLMVEPSFFSEMLGLQGRMDLLQLDLRLLAEQKSGKGNWPYNNFITPIHREQHYVQLLLYMLIIRYNYREKYEENGYRLDPFLLYSKYEKSLIALGFAPALIFKAVKIRNLIAARDIEYAERGFSELEELTPEMLNTNGANKLWNQYTRPQLSALLSPVRAVADLDRHYYLRFMRFIAKEHLLAKTGTCKKENSGFASTWQSPLDEKIESGNIYTGLIMDTELPETGKIEKVRLHFTEDERNAMANFRPGDVVILYSYPQDKEPDARKNMIFRGAIADISSESILIHLRAPQSSPRPFLNRLFPSSAPLRWAMEHDFIEASFNGLYRAMHSFLSAPQSRRDLLMFRRSPNIDKSLSLKLDHSGFNNLALKAKQARDLFLIVGPPGTGKTSFGLMTSLREELAEPGSNILMLAFTNRAVDEICSKLTEEGIEYIRLGSELSCSSKKENLLINKIAGCNSASALRSVILKTRVIVATTTALNAAPLLFRLKKFSLAIIDEASQILEPHIIGLLSALAPDNHPAIERFIMIGDHKQLPAVVQQTDKDSAVTEPDLKEIGFYNCSLSLFERLISRYGNNPDLCFMLTSQGRMHEKIADFPNKAFYNGKLKAVPLPHQIEKLERQNYMPGSIRDLLLSTRVAFINVIPSQRSASDKVNHDEARLIALMVKEIYSLNPQTFTPDRTVGVIVPYRNQISAIRNEIDAFDIPELREITIDTIERYQGSQRKFIIYGFTVRRSYQLDFLTNQTFKEGENPIDRKLNVAMTRAEEHLLLVGNAPLLKSNIIFSRLLNYLEERKALYSIGDLHPGLQKM